MASQINLYNRDCMEAMKEMPNQERGLKEASVKRLENHKKQITLF